MSAITRKKRDRRDWRSPSKNPPKFFKDVLVTVEDEEDEGRHVEFAFLQGVGGLSEWRDTAMRKIKPLAWCPAPEPYQGEPL